VTGRIFISYRRSDDQSAAGRLYDRLQQHFDCEQLFMDVDEPGVDFVKSLNEQLANCIAFVVVIGPRWLTARGNDGNPRLDNPTDYVRLEIEAALKRDIRVIPVLVDGASMPLASDLPSSLQALARRHAVEIAHHRFVADCDDLARGIKRALGIATTPSPPVQRFVSSSAPQEEVGAKPTWPQILFSFKGRLSRMPFLIGLFFLVALVVALEGSIMFALNSIFKGAEPPTEEVTKQLASFEDRLWVILTIGVWWPSWGLILKRLHDLGHGWKALLLFVALDVLSVVANLLGYQAIDTQVTLFSLGLAAMLGAIKGTMGANRYGPGPLAGEAV
jgi:uncharacterized membrane protein YhaH (DUF805 family)